MKKLSFIVCILLALTFALVSCDTASGTTTADTTTTTTTTTKQTDGTTSSSFTGTQPRIDGIYDFAFFAGSVGTSSPTKSVTSVITYRRATDRTLNSTEIYTVKGAQGEKVIRFEYSYESVSQFIPGVSDGGIVRETGTVYKSETEISGADLFKLAPSSLNMTESLFSDYSTKYAEQADTATFTGTLDGAGAEAFFGSPLGYTDIMVIFVCRATTAELLSLTVTSQNLSGTTVTESVSISSQYTYLPEDFTVPGN